MRMTKQRKDLIEDLDNGAVFMVTVSGSEHIRDYITVRGGAKRHSENVVRSLFDLLKSENKLITVDEGLFPGCGQCFKMVR